MKKEFYSIAKLITQNSKVLDVGCGNGELMKYITENISKAHRVAANIDSGVVWINTWLLRDLRIPFGGMKQSGVGREGGFKSLEFFTEPKNVCVKI